MTEVGSQYQAKICVAKTSVNDRVFLIEGGHGGEANVKQGRMNTQMELACKPLTAAA